MRMCQEGDLRAEGAGCHLCLLGRRVEVSWVWLWKARSWPRLEFSMEKPGFLQEMMAVAASGVGLLAEWPRGKVASAKTMVLMVKAP